MNAIIKISCHVYAQEHLCDEILDENLGDDIDSCGIIGPEIILPLRRNRDLEISVEYTTETTIKDIVNTIYDKLGLLDLDCALHPRIAFWSSEIRYWVDNIDALFETVVDKYLDPQKIGYVTAAVYVSGNAGSIFEEDGIRYYMNSREKGKHHEPHIHLRSLDSCEEAVIIIKTREVIGKFPRKLIKKAKQKVEKNEYFFLEQWNVLTDGLKVDINHYLGLINY